MRIREWALVLVLAFAAVVVSITCEAQTPLEKTSLAGPSLRTPRTVRDEGQGRPTTPQKLFLANWGPCAARR